MKKNPQFIYRQACGTSVLVNVKSQGTDNSIINLNETAAFIWDAIGDEEVNVDQIVDRILDEYEITSEDARQDVIRILHELQQAGCLI